MVGDEGGAHKDLSMDDLLSSRSRPGQVLLFHQSWVTNLLMLSRLHWQQNDPGGGQC